MWQRQYCVSDHLLHALQRNYWRCLECISYIYRHICAHVFIYIIHIIQCIQQSYSHIYTYNIVHIKHKVFGAQWLFLFRCFVTGFWKRQPLQVPTILFIYFIFCFACLWVLMQSGIIFIHVELLTIQVFRGIERNHWPFELKCTMPASNLFSWEQNILRFNVLC